MSKINADAAKHESGHSRFMTIWVAYDLFSDIFCRDVLYIYFVLRFVHILLAGCLLHIFTSTQDQDSLYANNYL